VGLDKQRRVIGVNSRRDVLRDGSAGVFAEFRWILRHGDGVKVDNTEHGVVRRLHLTPLQQRTGVITEVQ
jgi:hypothetical protein